MAEFTTSRNGEKLTLSDTISADTKPLVIGVDFGTAYSGVAYSYKVDQSIQYGAPTAKDPLETKVPTAILLYDDGSWLFGHAAIDAYNEMTMGAGPGDVLAGQLYRRFKMVLNGKTSGLETLTAMSVAGRPAPLLGLVVKTLQALKEYPLRKVMDGYGVQDTMRDIQWVLTVPAIWNDFGKAFMRRAAFLAGMISSEESENLMLVLEPEGASLAVHMGAQQYGLLGKGCNFMVLDCGGGTIDITTYLVAEVKPKLSLRSIADPVGGAWGGEYVNDAFCLLLKDLLGPLYTPDEAPHTFHNIMAEFEAVKQVFEPTSLPRNVRLKDALTKRGELEGLAAAYNARHPGQPQILMTGALRNDFLTMSTELMLSLFESCLACTEAATQAVLTAKPQVSIIIVVGGFGSSKVLTSRISTKFQSARLKVMLCDPNPRPQGAIAQGAVWFGLYKNIIDSRIAKWSYGVEMKHNGVEHTFYTLVNRGQELPIDHDSYVQGIPISDDQTQIVWRIFSSDLVDPTTVLNAPGAAHAKLLGTIAVECPPAATQMERKQIGHLKFGGPEIEVVFENAVGQKFRSCIRIE